MTDELALPPVPKAQVDIFHYIEATGEIRAIGGCKASDMALLEPMHEGWAVGYGQIAFGEIDKYYATDPWTIVERPSMGLPADVQLVADGEEEIVIGPLPEGCKVWIDGDEVTEFDEGNTLALSSDMPATYHLVFECWPYLRHVMEVTANAPAS